MINIPKTKRAAPYLAPVLLAFTLSACGGGGDDSTTSDNDAQATTLGAKSWRKRSTTTTTTTTTTSTPDTTSSTTSPTTTSTTSPATSTSSPTASTMATYSVVADGAVRKFDFDGSTPFVDPATGQSDMHDWLYNAKYLQYYEISNAGISPWISKVTEADGTQATRFQVFPSDAQIYNWRTQNSNFPFEPYKTYRYDLEFKLDPNWQFNMATGDGLLWQTKGMPKTGQYGHAVMSMGVTGSNLYFSVLYPNSALNATTWPTSVTWPSNDYAATNFPTKPIVAGRYYKVSIEFFADDRPPQFGGQGYVNVYLDGALWIQYKGPNLHPDQNGPHRWDFGWYNWGGQPTSTRSIYFKTAHAYVK